MSIRPLRITWSLARPMICPQHPIHLDALLARARVIEEGEDWAHQHDLPLEREEQGGQWCFKASALVLEAAEAVRFTHMSRRTEVTRIALDGQADGIVKLGLSEIPTGSGPLKGYSWFAHTQWVSKATAWCIGEPERIMELLTRIPCIGKLSRNSHGLIKSWDVQEDSRAERLWMRRALPATFAGTPVMETAVKVADYATAMSRFTPPYWSRELAETLEVTSHFREVAP